MYVCVVTTTQLLLLLCVVPVFHCVFQCNKLLMKLLNCTLVTIHHALSTSLPCLGPVVLPASRALHLANVPTTSILSGITRKSVFELAKEWGYKVEERRVSVAEIVEASKAGQIYPVKL